MNPIKKCCGYFCSCILVVSLFLLWNLFEVIKERNWWIIYFSNDTDTKFYAIVIVMIMNALCLVLCAGCTLNGVRAEKEEQLRLMRRRRSWRRNRRGRALTQAVVTLLMSVLMIFIVINPHLLSFKPISLNLEALFKDLLDLALGSKHSEFLLNFLFLVAL